MIAKHKLLTVFLVILLLGAGILTYDYYVMQNATSIQMRYGNVESGSLTRWFYGVILLIIAGILGLILTIKAIVRYLKSPTYFS